jgi:hypothetical protein
MLSELLEYLFPDPAHERRDVVTLLDLHAKRGWIDAEASQRSSCGVQSSDRVKGKEVMGSRSLVNPHALWPE